jgi:hypothetical protein
MTAPSDWRALCAELLKAVDDMPWEYDWRGEPVGPLAEIDEAPFDRARTALPQPEPQGPSEAELKTFACNWWHTFGFAKDKATCTWVIDHIAPEHFADFSRDVLARWGTPAIEPVPVAERPWEREGWCDDSGWCWGFDADDTDPYWSFDKPEQCPTWTHLLPHHALPLPASEAQS